MPKTKRLRLMIDFEIEIADQPPLLPPGTVEPPDPEYDERQTRLLKAVKSQPQVLTRWLQQCVIHQMNSHGWQDWDMLIAGGEIAYETILSPAIKTLSEEDQKFFNTGATFKLFEDYVDMFVQSFVVKESSPTIVEQLPTQTRLQQEKNPFKKRRPGPA